MSNALARMRSLCDDPLFVRTSQGMQPTTFALELAEPVRQALSLVSSALQVSNRFDPAKASRRFTLVMSDIGEAMFVPPLMKAVQRQARLIDIRVLQLPRDRVAVVLETGAADLALGRFADLLKSYFAQRLFTDDYACIMRKSHPIAKKRRMTLADYEGASHVVAAPPGYGGAQIDATLAERGIRRRVQLEVPHYLVIPLILKDTDLIATVPERVLRTIPNPTDFHVTKLPLQVAKVEVHQFWHARFHHDAGNKWLRAIFADYFHGGAN
jgi:DNA-binding transcriptional LysR family regulator